MNTIQVPDDDTVLVVNPSQTDYGMVAANFGPPSTSFSEPLSSFEPTEFQVIPCAPSKGSTDCRKGSNTYNLGMSVQDMPV